MLVVHSVYRQLCCLAEWWLLQAEAVASWWRPALLTPAVLGFASGHQALLLSSMQPGLIGSHVFGFPEVNLFSSVMSMFGEGLLNTD